MKKFLFVLVSVITYPIYMIGVGLVNVCLLINSAMEDWANEK